MPATRTIAAALALLPLCVPPCAAAEEAKICRFDVPPGTGQIDFSPAQIFSKCKEGDQLVLLNGRSDFPEFRVFQAAALACDATRPIVFASNRTSFVCTYRGQPQTR